MSAGKRAEVIDLRANVAVSNIDADLRSHSRWLKQIVDPVRLEIIYALAQTDEATADQLATTGISSKPTLRRHLNALVTLGLVHRQGCESDGLTTGRPPIRFSLPADIRAGVLAVFGTEA
ncbi:MAG TPA: ArsR family transcriptional regulator [Solirubrobacterales bacterium]|jgi:DNA-binding transcriptional ArsR family regulator|nr:ArsR family transcriptional regulator [Solirubrobacterales bacterium]